MITQSTVYMARVRGVQGSLVEAEKLLWWSVSWHEERMGTESSVGEEHIDTRGSRRCWGKGKSVWNEPWITHLCSLCLLMLSPSCRSELFVGTRPSSGSYLQSYIHPAKQHLRVKQS